MDVLIQVARIVTELPAFRSSINPRVQKYPYRRILDLVALHYDFEQPTDSKQCTANGAASTALALSLRSDAAHSAFARTATHARRATSDSGAAIS